MWMQFQSFRVLDDIHIQIEHGEICDFHHGMAAGAECAGLSISDTALDLPRSLDLLRVKHLTMSRQNGVQNIKHPELYV